MTTIFDEFSKRVTEHPDKLLYMFLDKNGKTKESYTYSEFQDRTISLAQYLQSLKYINTGDRILLAYPPGLEMICAFFACARIGLIPVPVYPPASQGFQSSLQKMNFIAEDCSAVAVLTDRTFYWSTQINLTRKRLATFSFTSETVSKLKWIVSSDARYKSAKELEEKTSEILFIQYTSGSTNQPKGVMVTHENIIHNCHSVVDHTPIGVSWLPQYHDMGLIGYYLFFALKGGTTYGFSPLDFIQRPALWLETISKFKATASSAPNFAYEYCLRPGKIPEETYEQLDLSSLQFLMTAAEPIRTKAYTEFLAKMEPYGLKAESFFAAYGLAEFSLAVSNYGRTFLTFDSKELAKHNALPVINPLPDQQVHHIMSCGLILGDTQLKIVDVRNEPKELRDGQIGEVWLNGSSKCKGYWNRPELTTEQFHAQLPNSNQTWLRTGDLGFMFDKELYICGRTKDMIIVRGLNYYPHDIELIVEQDKHIRKGCVAVFSVEENDREKVIVIAELRSENKILNVDELNQQVQQYLGIQVDEFVFIPARTISKTSSGKIMRSFMKQRYLEGDLKVIDRIDLTTKQLEVNNIDEKVNTIDLNQLGVYGKLFQKYNLNGTESESLADLGFDSLKLAEFAHDLKGTIQAEGFEELANEIDLRLLQKIAMVELFELVQGLHDAKPQAKFRFKSAFNRIHKEYTAVELEMMRKDAQFSIGMEMNWRSEEHKRGGDSILLTGASGFFGPFLLKSILEQNKEEVFVLVRAKNEQEGMIRIRKALETVNAKKELLLEFASRVKAIPGDLAKPRFGLSEAQWNELDYKVHTIYHNGAIVNYLLDYESMRDINVGGTNEIIRLAMGKVTKTINHISTTFIFGWSVKDTLYETDQNELMERLDFGYSQSKWVSEQLLFNAMNIGLPVRVFRPALISPSIKGEGYNFDISIRLLAFMLKHGIGTTAQNQVSFTPADIGANNIVAISNLPESIGKTFHVTRDQYASMQDITSILSKLTNTEFMNFNLMDFVPEVVGRCQKEDLLFPLLNFLVKSVDNISSMEFKLYSNANYCNYRSASSYGIEDPDLEKVVQGILTFMTNQNIVTNSTMNPNTISID